MWHSSNSESCPGFKLFEHCSNNMDLWFVRVFKLFPSASKISDTCIWYDPLRLVILSYRGLVLRHHKLMVILCVTYTNYLVCHLDKSHWYSLSTNLLSVTKKQLTMETKREDDIQPLHGFPSVCNSYGAWLGLTLDLHSWPLYCWCSWWNPLILISRQPLQLGLNGTTSNIYFRLPNTLYILTNCCSSHSTWLLNGLKHNSSLISLR